MTLPATSFGHFYLLIFYIIDLSIIFRNCSIIETTLTVITMMISGVVSDNKGRKLPLMWNLSWNFLSIFSLIIVLSLDSSNSLGLHKLLFMLILSCNTLH